MASPDVCPASAHLLAFAREDGSVARMAVVRPANESAPASKRPASSPAASSPAASSPAASSPPASSPPASVATIGRYIVGPRIATGGMATVHLGRLRGPAGFARTVAIKRLLPELAGDPEFVRRFVDEARIASRIRHANVVPTLDVVDEPDVLLVLEYVHGESLARLLRIAASRHERCPPSVASAIIIGVLRGLHVAHEAKGSNGVPLELVHRDVSPQNVIVGADGTPRMLDFGIAKASGSEQSTLTRANDGRRDVRGKLAYMAPEQVTGEPLDRRADIFAAGVMLWETLAGERLFRGEDAMTTMEAIFHRDPPLLAATVPGISSRVDEVLAMALAKDAGSRFATADEMARALEAAIPPGSDREVAEWVETIASEVLAARAALMAGFEGSTDPGDEHDTQEPTQKRNALKTTGSLPRVPTPPRIRDEAKTLPGYDPAVPPAALVPVDQGDVEPVRTPMSMVTERDPLGVSGMTSTRVGPLELESKRPSKAGPPRTPIPMPIPERKSRTSAIRVAALVLVPPLVAALSLFVLRPAVSGSATHATATAAKAPVVAAADVPPPPVPPPVATLDLTAPAAPAAVAKFAEPTPHPSASASPRGPRTPRPWTRPPRKR